MSKESEEIKKRRDTVDNALGILLTATPLPNNRYVDALDDYVAGKITLEELDENVHNLKYCMDDLYCYKNSNVLLNKYDIRDKEAVTIPLKMLRV